MHVHPADVSGQRRPAHPCLGGLRIEALLLGRLRGLEEPSTELVIVVVLGGRALVADKWGQH